MRKWFAILLLALTASCGDNNSTNPATASVAGTYTLRTINGTALPFTLFGSGANKVEITSDVVVLNEGGTWTETGNVRTTTNGQATNESSTDSGTYTRNGTAITLTSAASGSLSGTVSNGTLTLTDQGLSAVYTR